MSALFYFIQEYAPSPRYSHALKYQCILKIMAKGLFYLQKGGRLSCAQ